MIAETHSETARMVSMAWLSDGPRECPVWARAIRMPAVLPRFGAAVKRLHGTARERHAAFGLRFQGPVVRLWRAETRMGMPKDAVDITTAAELVDALKFYLEAALERIDAVPREVTDALAMPGFGRDEAEALLALDVRTLEQDGVGESPTP